MYVKDELGYKKRVKHKIKRPILITVLCISVVLFGFWSLISSYIGIYSGFGTMYPAANALMIVFSFVAISGVWVMEKWGPIAYNIVIALKLLIDAAFGHFNAWYLLAFVPGILFLIIMPRMRKTN
jgi:hypothetical protein